MIFERAEGFREIETTSSIYNPYLVVAAFSNIFTKNKRLPVNCHELQQKQKSSLLRTRISLENLALHRLFYSPLFSIESSTSSNSRAPILVSNKSSMWGEFQIYLMGGRQVGLFGWRTLRAGTGRSHAFDSLGRAKHPNSACFFNHVYSYLLQLSLI